MKAVQITEKIRYLACSDEKGDFGLLMYKGDGFHPFRIVEVQGELDFKFWYNQFAHYENA